MWGQVVNLVTNRVARVIGLGEANERFVMTALFQGSQRPDISKAARLAESNRGPTRSVIGTFLLWGCLFL